MLCLRSSCNQHGRDELSAGTAALYISCHSVRRPLPLCLTMYAQQSRFNDFNHKMRAFDHRHEEDALANDLLSHAELIRAKLFRRRVPGDGHCQFHAIACQTDGTTVRELRSRSITWLRDHMQVWEATVADTEDYLARLQHDEYGDQFTLLAMCSCFGRAALVWEKDAPALQPLVIVPMFQLDTTAKPFYLEYDPANGVELAQHYDALLLQTFSVRSSEDVRHVTKQLQTSGQSTRHIVRMLGLPRTTVQSSLKRSAPSRRVRLRTKTWDADAGPYSRQLKARYLHSLGTSPKLIASRQSVFVARPQEQQGAIVCRHLALYTTSHHDSAAVLLIRNTRCNTSLLVNSNISKFPVQCARLPTPLACYLPAFLKQHSRSRSCFLACFLLLLVAAHVLLVVVCPLTLSGRSMSNSRAHSACFLARFFVLALLPCLLPCYLASSPFSHGVACLLLLACFVACLAAHVLLMVVSPLTCRSCFLACFSVLSWRCILACLLLLVAARVLLKLKGFLRNICCFSFFACLAAHVLLASSPVTLSRRSMSNSRASCKHTLHPCSPGVACFASLLAYVLLMVVSPLTFGACQSQGPRALLLLAFIPRNE
eukprot:5419032-Amphidinium_carterae.2